MTVQDVLGKYESRLLDLQTSLTQFLRPQAFAFLLSTAALGLLLVMGIYVIRGKLLFVWPAFPILIAAVSVRRLQQIRQSESRIWRLKRFYERSRERVKGNWAGAGFAGEEFSEPDHVYAADLNVLGEGSLFELLCVARTSIGRRGLADYLLHLPKLSETLLRQEAVRELRANLELRERIATLGEFAFLESHHDPFDRWLSSSRISFPRPLPAIAAVSSAVLAGVVIAGLLGIIPWTSVAIGIAPLVAFHGAIGLLFRDRVNRMLESLRPLSIETRVLREGLRLLEEERFQSAKLKQLTEQARDGAASMRSLERLLDAVNQRNKEWFYGPSLLLLAGTQLCMAIEQWRAEHGESLQIWLHAWAEFEALNAIAAYSYENPEHTFPDLAGPGRGSGDTACFEAEDLGHPLLPRASCVVNNIELNSDCRFYIVSGSNMSGKSTLLRAIGLNAVLALAGAPVRAGALRLSGLSIFASISIADSLLNGKSKFLAEVERLRRALESSVPERPVLFLVDEIFGGTNSRDRRIAAEAVVRALVNRGAIGALSTHDLALTEIAGAESMRGVNVHMGSRTRPGGDADPMDFDFRLKPGVTAETNALAIARLAGVPV